MTLREKVLRWAVPTNVEVDEDGKAYSYLPEVCC
jgi:hypothetical protein